MDDVSWVGVLVGALALFVLAAIWYTALFGRAYRQELGVPGPNENEPAKAPPDASVLTAAAAFEASDPGSTSGR